MIKKSFLILLMVLCSSSLFATPPSIVQCKQGSAPFNNSGTHTITFDSAPASGNHWIAMSATEGFSVTGQHVTANSDNYGNSSTTHGGESSGFAPNSGDSISSAKITSTGSSFAVSFTLADGNDLYGGFWACEAAGLDPTTWFDGITLTGPFFTGTSQTLSRSGANTVNNSLVVAIAATNNHLTAHATSGYTDIQYDAYENVAYKAVTSIETSSVIWTYNTPTDGAVALIAVFRGIDGGSTVVARRTADHPRVGSR